MKISNEKREKIYEQILAVLYSNFPRALFTFHVAREIARDEEFVKELLSDLCKKKLIIEIKKNSKGVLYKKRLRWKMNDLVYKKYKDKQSSFD